MRRIGSVIVCGAILLSLVSLSRVSAYPNGLLGRYWKDKFFGVDLPAYPGCATYNMPLPGPYGTPTLTRVDEQICFTKDDSIGFNSFPWDWRPYPVGVDDAGNRHGFSVKWTGWILLNDPGTYKFALQSDDGSWLYIDGQLLINNGGAHDPTPLSASYDNVAVGVHEIVIDFYETCDSQCGIVFYWKQPAHNTNNDPWEIVPSDALQALELPNPSNRVPEFGLELPIVTSLALAALSIGKRRLLKVTSK